MKKALVCLLMSLSIFIGVPKAHAWSDDVQGVLMPSPRGGGGISAEEAEGAMYNSEENSPVDAQALVEWE